MSKNSMINSAKKNESSIKEIWQLLIRRKFFFFYTWVILSLSASIFSLQTNEKYIYTTFMEIGGTNTNLIESAEASRVRIIHYIIPKIEKNIYEESGLVINLEVIAKTSSTLLLKSRSITKLDKEHYGFHKAISDEFIKNHQIIFNKKFKDLIGNEEIDKEILFLKNSLINLEKRLDIYKTNHLKSLNTFEENLILKTLSETYLLEIEYKLAANTMKLNQLLLVKKNQEVELKMTNVSVPTHSLENNLSLFKWIIKLITIFIGTFLLSIFLTVIFNSFLKKFSFNKL